MRRYLGDGQGTVSADRDRTLCFIPAIDANGVGKALPVSGLLGWPEFLIAATEVAAGPEVERRDGFAMQPVGGPVGSDIAAVAPD